MIKKIVLLLFATSIYLSCDAIVLEDSAFIKLNPLPSGIEKVHLAIFNDSWDEENLIKVTEITSTNTTIEVPVGDNMTFLFVGENNEGTGEYFAVRSDIFVNNDGTSNLGTVDLNRFDNSSLNPSDGSPMVVNNLYYLDTIDELHWTDVGATSYDIYFNGKFITTTTNNDTYQFGADHSTWGNYFIICHYSFFGIVTIMSEEINVG